MANPSSRKAHVHLRYGGTLPEGLDLAVAMGADELALFVPSAEEHCDGPATGEEIERTAVIAGGMLEKARGAGLLGSINLFWTVGFSDYPCAPRSARGRFDFRWAVNVNGVESAVIACPIDEVWRAHMTGMYARYARLKPRVIWLDDDVRMTLRADVQGPCLCGVCMGEMERRTGRAWERKELIAAVVADGESREKPNEVRKAWLGFQREIVETLVARLAEAVHQESAETQVGLMFSPPETHAPEGRRWGAYFGAAEGVSGSGLRGSGGEDRGRRKVDAEKAHPHPSPPPEREGAREEHPHPSPPPEGEGVREAHPHPSPPPEGEGIRPIGRPGIGCYTEGGAFEIAKGLAWARQVQRLAPGYELAPEIENYPYSSHAKSYALDKVQMVLCQLLGMNQVTVNVLPFAAGGSALIAEDACGQIRSVKGRLNAIAALALKPEKQVGVRIFVHEDVAEYVTGCGGAPKPILMMRKRPWETSLPLLGVPTTFHESAVTAVQGEEIDCLGEAELEALFASGVLLDARAAECLLKRGLGWMVGVMGRKGNAVHCKETPVAQNEHPHPSPPPDGEGVRSGYPMNTRYDGEGWQFEWEKGAEVMSEFRDYNDRVTGHGVVRFENGLGGRVVVMPFDSQAGAMVFGVPSNALASPGFVSPSRQVFLQPLIRWLFKGEGCPAFYTGFRPVYPLVMELEDGGVVAALANLGADEVDARGWVEKVCAGREFEWLDEEGVWRGMGEGVEALSRLGMFQVGVVRVVNR
jgi:hypothetical protein